MSFRITGLSAEPFAPLFGLSDAELALKGAKRYVADATSGYPDRVSLRDVDLGESVLLVNHVHQTGATPYRASHAIFVREAVVPAFDGVDEIPGALRPRVISLRAFAADDMMIDADLVDGTELEGLIKKFFANPEVAYMQAHFAKRGCFAARIDRA